MITTYEDYLSKPKSLTTEEMGCLHQAMLLEISQDEDALELYEELMVTAVRYASIRSGWLLLSVEEKMDRDSSRTMCHNSLIVKFNQLAKYLRLQGKPAQWRDCLGYEEDDRYNRKRIGDFACYLAFLSAINAR